MSGLPEWAEWQVGHEYTLGVEEEVMLLNPHDWSLAQQIDRVLPAMSEELSAYVSAETHRSALELRTNVHQTAAAVGGELLRVQDELEPVRGIAARTGAQRQLELARGAERLKGLVESLADAFCAETYAGPGETGAPSGSVAAG